jgi:4-alpha-glucanotransferase
MLARAGPVSHTAGRMDAWGITDGYWDVAGEWHPTDEDVRAALLLAMGAEGDAPPRTPYWSVTAGDAHHLNSLCELRLEDGTLLPALAQLPPDLPVGYHDLQPLDGGPVTRLVVAPRSLSTPPRAWGWSIQLYALRSRWSWGLGDLADLRELMRWTASLGGGAVLLNPLHANTPSGPQQPSPYYPSSRRFRNILYLRIAEVPGATSEGGELAQLDQAGRALNAVPRLDRDRVLTLKLAALERIFRAQGADVGGEAFRRWRAAQGPSLERWATFCTIAETHGPAWTTWTESLRHPESPSVAEAAARAPDRLRFHAWCQWLVDEQLRAAAASSPARLLQDLAVGFDPTGFDAWCDQDLLALTCRIGAPPDELGPEGQDWGLPPYVPWKLRAARFEPFIDALRTALGHARGLRIDHVMGLFRQYWLPPGSGPNAGAYVRFPSDELLDVVAVEASRQDAFVVGEDLGTVEPEVRAALRSRGILGTTLGWFEDVPPTEYEPATLTALTTHDLPTAAGVITGADAAAIHRLQRKFDDTKIRERLDVLVPNSVTVPDTVVALHRALAAAPTALVLAQVDDAICAVARPNLPGTVDEWPNWCLPLPLSLEQITTHPTARAVAEALSHRPPTAAEPGPDGERS